MTDDADLLRHYGNDGSEEAFAELVRRYIGIVYSVALRKTAGDPFLAQEAVQSVFTDLARKSRTLSTHPVLSAWLFKSTHFAATNLMRTERRRQHREQQGCAMHDLLSDSAPAIDWDSLRPVLDDAIGELSDRDREAVMLRFFHGLDFPALGARLNLSAEGARSRVDRAVEKLHAALTRRGITSTIAAVGLAMGEHAIVAVPAGLASTITQTALAAAGTTTAVGAAALFIGSIKLPLAIAAAAAIAGAAVYQTQGRRDTPGLRQAAHSIEMRATATAVSAVARPAATTTPTAEIPSAPATENDPTVAAGDALMEKNPAVKELLVRSQRANRAATYFPLYVELGFDDRKATAFEEIMCSNGAGANYMNMIGPGKITLRVFPKLSNAEREQRLRELLGETGFQRYKAYDVAACRRAMEVATGLYFTDTPLTKPQAEQFALIFSETKGLGYGSGNNPRVYWAHVIDRARTVLNPVQLHPLEIMRATDELIWARRVAGQSATRPPPAGPTTLSSAPQPTRTTPPAISLATFLDQNANNAEIQLLELARERAQFVEDYGPLFQTQAWSTDQIKRFTDLFVGRIEQHDDLDVVRRTQKSFRSAAIRSQRQVVETNFEAAVTELLGAEGWAKLRDYERSRPARGFVGRLAGIAAVSGISHHAPAG